MLYMYTKYKSSGTCSFRHEDFWKWHHENILWPNDVFMQPSGTVWLTLILIGEHTGITSFEFGQNPISGSGEKIVQSFPYIIHCKIVTPGRGRFWPQEHYLNDFGRGHLDDVIYQIWKLWALLLSTRRFLKIKFWTPIFWPIDLLVQPTGTLIGKHPWDHSCEVCLIPISSLKGEVVWIKNVNTHTHERRTT